MTRDEILAMKPGRRLDALVAEKILGWEITWPVTDDCDWSVGVHGRKNYGINPETGKDEPLPYPSQIIDHAWKVAVTHDWFRLRKQGVNYMFVIEHDDHSETWADADNAPEAICKASLLWKLNEYGKI